MPLFGIDTLTSRLDLIMWDAFIKWNGGAPAFAGRNFLGCDHLWLGSEATTSLRRRRQGASKHRLGKR